MNRPRLRRLSADGVDDDGERRSGPGLDQPGGLAVHGHELHAGRCQVTQPCDDCRPGTVVTAELVADADHHGRVAARALKVRRWNGNHRPFGSIKDFHGEVKQAGQDTGNCS
jgi:hypothetical protein